MNTSILKAETKAVSDFSMSYWLKARIMEIRTRDILDMYYDVEYLRDLMASILKESGLKPY